MKKVTIYLLGLFLMLGLSQCTTLKNWMAPEKGPTIAHVHIGHAMTGWKHAPGKKGLFVVAEQEAKTAQTHANNALQKPDDLKHIKLHVGYVMHAVDPKTQKKGPGLGFGQKRALTDALSHITFAAESDDASENVQNFAKTISLYAEATLERCYLIMALGQDILQTNSAEEAATLAEEIAKLTRANIEGVNAGGNGGVTDPDHYGLKQLRTQITEMTDREDPPYRPVSRRYLFGLIRLPSGEWTYWWHVDREKSGGDGGGGGY